MYVSATRRRTRAFLFCSAGWGGELSADRFAGLAPGSPAGGTDTGVCLWRRVRSLDRLAIAEKNVTQAASVRGKFEAPVLLPSLEFWEVYCYTQCLMEEERCLMRGAQLQSRVVASQYSQDKQPGSWCGLKGPAGPFYCLILLWFTSVICWAQRKSTASVFYRIIIYISLVSGQFEVIDPALLCPFVAI